MTSYFIRDKEVHFKEVDWDFSYVYILNFFGAVGTFIGEKQFLVDFVSTTGEMRFEIVDETYGYNKSWFSGYLSMGSRCKECNIEIYHLGAMEYHTEE